MNEKKIKERLCELIGTMSNRDFAKKCGSNETNIRNYRAGRRLPTVKNLAEIAAANGVSIAWLIGETDEKNFSPAVIDAPAGNEKFNDMFTLNMSLVSEWVKEQYPGQDIQAIESFKDDFKERFPEFLAWWKKRKTNLTNNEPKV